MILEKTFAKTYGSYERVESGNTEHSLRDLTGAPSYTYETDKEENLFSLIHEADKKDFVMCASAHTTTQDQED